LPKSAQQNPSPQAFPSVMPKPPVAVQVSRDVFLARQPIYDAKHRIHAYELLFRRADLEAAEVIDGNRATAQVFLNTLIDIGLDKLASRELLFINCTRDVLMLDPILPPDRCVLEVLEDIDIDDELLARMKDLRKAGYRFALDDFVYAEKFAPAIELSDYVKLDVLNLSREELRKHVQLLRRYRVSLIAEKIDSEAQMAYCMKLGFDLFQGYYLRRPDVLKSKRINTGRMAALRLIGECQKTEASLAAISSMISADVSMTYSLLRMANSAIFGWPSRIQTISEATSRLGTTCVLRWATLLALASDKNCPKGYLESALLRARMCESLTSEQTQQSGETLFLVGLLSSLDCIIGIPMPELMEKVPLSDEVRAALLSRKGELGRILKAVMAYEAGDWPTVMTCGIKEDRLRQAYFTSLDYSASTSESLQSA
jgi:c-di-GMP phosphodiesterase